MFSVSSPIRNSSFPSLRTSVVETSHELYAVIPTLTHETIFLAYVNVIMFLLYEIKFILLLLPTPNEKKNISENSVVPQFVWLQKPPIVFFKGEILSCYFA